MTVKIFEVNKPGRSLLDRARKFVCPTDLTSPEALLRPEG